MNSFNGIPISESRLLVHGIIFTVMLALLTVAFGYYLYASLTMKGKNERAHLKKLKEKAQTDELAKKRLQKIERKSRRQCERRRSDRFFEAFIMGISVCLAVTILFWAVIPAWTDYARKDYAVYTGEIKVNSQTRNPYIKLGDGTTVWGRGDFDTDDTYGTVVYSRRTKQFLGGTVSRRKYMGKT